MKPKLFIRADGNSTIGLGHLIRSLALAQMIREDFVIYFCSITSTDSFVNELNKNDIIFYSIRSDEDFLTLLEPQSGVVLDGYQFTTDFQKKIKNKSCKLVCIDDIHDKEYYADLIINQSPVIEKGQYICQPYTQFALGLKYALLRSSFISAAKQERNVSKIGNVLVCFGGADINNFTYRTAIELLSNKFLKNIFIVTGSAYKYKSDLTELSKKNEKVKHFHDIPESEMLSIMLKSDLAIVPASGVLLEALAAGCQVIFGYYVDNQKETSDYLGNTYLKNQCIGNFDEGIKYINARIDNLKFYSNISLLRNSISQSDINNRAIFKQLFNS